MATKKKAGRWSGAKQSGNAAAGRSKADSDRKLQQHHGEVLPVLGGQSG